MDWFLFFSTLTKIIVIVFCVNLPLIAYTVYAERRVSALIQDRRGPNRVGIAGLLQPMADGIKFILKEDFTPGHVKKFYYWLAPALTMVPALLTFAVIPFGSELNVFGKKIPLVIADLDVGPLFVFAIASLGVYGIVLAGWSSNSKYPFLGSVRSSSQMISYEIALGLSIVPILLIFGELNLNRIVEWQSKNGWLILPQGFQWHDLALWGLILISFGIFSISIFAETNRVPFDLPECETELVGGYHTEYSSMKFALFFLGEYAAMIVGSGLAVTLFLGGWSLPFGWDQSIINGHDGVIPWWLGLLHMLCFFSKVVFFLIFFIWVRWSIPRFRFDQLMRLGWVWFFEIAVLNVFLTAALLWWLGKSALLH